MGAIHFKKITYVLIAIFLSYQSIAMGGVNFEKNLNWLQIQAKARAERKYIFVDCFATWCAPCKSMDKNIFSIEKVGSYMDEHFISIKVQMDTSTADNDEIKKWYADAHRIMMDYNVKSYPSYLFFTPEGKIVHRDLGYRNEEKFMQLMKDVFDTSKQYYTLLENYQQGKKNFNSMLYLAQMTRALGQSENANKIKQEYLHDYIYQLDDEELYTQEKLRFIAATDQETNDKGFRIFYNESGRVDSIMGRIGYARQVVESIIYSSEVYPTLIKCKTVYLKEPGWDELMLKITSKYDSSYAENVLLRARLNWYGSQKDWTNLAKYMTIHEQRFGIDTTRSGLIQLNNNIYLVLFEHVNDIKVLKTAIEWQAEIVRRCPSEAQFLDTYANLLYKTGQVQEAVDWEGKALSLSPKDNGIQAAYEKMKRGEPTWPSE